LVVEEEDGKNHTKAITIKNQKRHSSQNVSSSMILISHPALIILKLTNEPTQLILKQNIKLPDSKPAFH
jgi:hypothetical protein